MTATQDLDARRAKATPRGVMTRCPIYVTKAKNAEIWDNENKRYIDFAGGIGVLNMGHLNPTVMEAVQTQLTKFSHVCYHVAAYEEYITLAEKINDITPIEGDKKSVFFVTGAEAIENAIKIARKATARPGVIAFTGAYHGRTSLTLALTGKVAPYKLDFGPFPPDIYHAIYPNPLHGHTVKEALNSIEAIFASDIPASKVAAIIIEPVQGEGGFNITPDEFMIALRNLCDKHGIVLIFDEVQSGFCRTGKIFATDYFSIKPDIITFAKSLGAGFPISGVVGKADIMDAPPVGGLGGTYCGHPMGIAAANAVLDFIKTAKINDRSLQLGEKLKQHLLTLKKAIPAIWDVRGLGSMVAVEFFNPKTQATDSHFAVNVHKHAFENGLILLTCGVDNNIIRFLYPLTIEEHIFDEALTKITQAIQYAASQA